MTEFKAPPLGLTPKYIHDAVRINQIFGAMMRYSESNMIIPLEWIIELQDLVKEKRG